MTRKDDPEGVIAWVEEKAAQITGLPVSHGEASAALLLSSGTVGGLLAAQCRLLSMQNTVIVNQ
jgi:hypothetical protein